MDRAHREIGRHIEFFDRSGAAELRWRDTSWFMLIDCHHCPLRLSAAFRPMSPHEIEAVREAKVGERQFPARTDIMVEGEEAIGLYTIFSGWTFRYKELRSGGRQLLDILLPGDLIGLQSEMTGILNHSVKAVTDVRVCRLDGRLFHNLFETQPALMEALVATLLVEEQRADARILLLGRQYPAERLGYFFFELRERLQRRGRSADDSIELPLTYQHLADLVGVSRSQLGASLRELPQRGWAKLVNRRLTFLDPQKMASECEYAPLPDPALRTLI